MFFFRISDSMYRSISPRIAVEKYDMMSMRILYLGAAPLGRPRRHHPHVSPKSGCRRRCLAGYIHPDDANMHISSVGRVLPNLEVRLVHEDARGERVAQQYVHGFYGCCRSLRTWKGQARCESEGRLWSRCLFCAVGVRSGSPTRE